MHGRPQKLSQKKSFAKSEGGGADEASAVSGDRWKGWKDSERRFRDRGRTIMALKGKAVSVSSPTPGSAGFSSAYTPHMCFASEFTCVSQVCLLSASCGYAGAVRAHWSSEDRSLTAELAWSCWETQGHSSDKITRVCFLGNPKHIETHKLLWSMLEDMSRNIWIMAISSNRLNPWKPIQMQPRNRNLFKYLF